MTYAEFVALAALADEIHKESLEAVCNRPMEAGTLVRWERRIKRLLADAIGAGLVVEAKAEMPSVILHKGNEKEN